jgi:hypothetical protein
MHLLMVLSIVPSISVSDLNVSLDPLQQALLWEEPGKKQEPCDSEAIGQVVSHFGITRNLSCALLKQVQILILYAHMDSLLPEKQKAKSKKRGCCTTLVSNPEPS